MPISWEKMQANASAFAGRSQNATSEKGQSRLFTTDLLRVFGVADPEQARQFEFSVNLDDGKSGYIDYLWKGKIAIEMKLRGKDLARAWQPLKEYAVYLPKSDLPNLLMVSDFETIILYDRILCKKHSFRTADLRKKNWAFAAIAGNETAREHEDQAAASLG